MSHLTSAAKMMSDLELEEATMLPPTITKDELLEWLDNDELEMETACGQCLLPPDSVEGAIRAWVSRLEGLGYYSDDAQLAVFDALAYLVEKEIIPDTPMMEASDDDKSSWIELFDKKIHARLVAVGIDFSEAKNDEQVQSEHGDSMDQEL